MAKIRGVKFLRRKSRTGMMPPGMPPGSIVADPSAPKPVLSVIAYGASGHEEISPATLDDVRRLRGSFQNIWLNVDGLGDAAIVTAIGEMFGLHKLALEDVMSGMQRPKTEPFGETVFVVIREPHKGEYLDSDQISLFIGRGFLVSFQEKRGDCFEPVRQRIRTQRGKICTLGADYLAYSLIDAVIDAYFPVLEAMGERLEELEDEAILRPSRETSHSIHATKRELLNIRRAVWPARDAIGMLIRDPQAVITDETRVYLRDCFDHLVQLVEVLENYREIGSDLQDIYLSSMSHRLNEVMKVLTIIATIFMPLSWIAGVYGMNFNTEHPLNMPELHWKYGYFFSLALMLATAISLIVYFKHKKWIWSEPRSLPKKT